MDKSTLIVNDLPRCRFSEIIEVSNEQAIIEIQRKGETLLLVNGEPVSVVWHDNGPTSGHYYSLQGIEKNEVVKKRLAAFEQWVQDRLPDDFPLIQLFEIYSPLLKSGNYRLFYSFPYAYPIGSPFSYSQKLKGFELYLPVDERIGRGGLYLDEGVFLFSQDMSTINEERVKYYEEQIKQGAHPIIVSLGMEQDNEEDIYDLFTDSYPQFILDGHHKALAYQNINRQTVKNQTGEYLEPGVFHIIKLQSTVEDFTKVKRQEALAKLLRENEIEEIYQFYGL